MFMKKRRKFFYDCEFIESPGSLDLISIGIVNEDGTDDFYAINKDCNFDNACPWVHDNVLNHLPGLHNTAWMHKYQIKDALLEWLNPSKADPIETWGWFSAYDHVALCWIFGSMIELPAGMPMLTMDLKQLAIMKNVPHSKIPVMDESLKHDALQDAYWNRTVYNFLMEQ
jgi:hypothetical protein